VDFLTLFSTALISDVRAKVPKVEILLVGATARDLLLFYAHRIKAARGTEDIDLAFAVDSWTDFEKLRKSLLSSDALMWKMVAECEQVVL
jgi:predicted nucleotidyltransferase